MLGFFKSEPFKDSELGELRRSRGHWNGYLVLPPCGTFRLRIEGDRHAPNPAVLALAREVPAKFRSLVPSIEQAMFGHYEPYREAIESGEPLDVHCPVIASPELVWPHVTPAHVIFWQNEDVPTVEIAFRVGWDIEHTIGARFKEWTLVELNGSVRSF
jgi:hypothetical protein